MVRCLRSTPQSTARANVRVFGPYGLDHRGAPYTEALKLTERFRRPNFGTLEIEVTVDDAKAYTKPFTFRIIRRIVADGSEMVEYICHENQNFLKLTAPRR